MSKKSDFKYPDGTPICNGDMLRFTDWNIGFVFFDQETNMWSVKYPAHNENRAGVMSLQNAVEYIREYLF